MIVDLQGREIGWQPLPKQALALECPALELCYGGEKAGGKTEFIVVCWTPLLQIAARKFAETGREQHKCRIVVFRKNLDDLKDWIAKSHSIYPLLDKSAFWSSSDKTWIFGSRATVAVRHLDGPHDHLGWNGQELPGVGYDQVEQLPFEAYTFINANCRSSDPDYWNARMIRSTANPGGYDWVAKYFRIDDCPDGGRIFVDKITDRHGQEHEITKVFIRARLHENTHVPPAYEAQLRSWMNEDEIAMYLEGDFFRVAGSFFSRFVRHNVHFVKSQPIPGSWEMGYSIDWGSSEPASLHVGAENPADKSLWVIDELYGPGDTGSRFGERMRKFWASQAWSPDRIWKSDDFYGVIDKQAFDNYGADSSAGAGIQSKGFRIFPAEKDRGSGCNQMKERLLMNRAGLPQVRIFADKCPKLVSALSKIKSNAPEKPDEYEPRSEHSHACDSFRFLCKRFPLADRGATDPMDEEVLRWERMLNAKPAATHDTGRMTSGYGD